MSEHTPGPWYIEPTSDFNASFRVMDVQEVTVALCYQQPADTWLAESNARLIAAAPELLEALKCTLEALENWVELVLAGDEDRDPTYEALQASRARAIIAKAEGE